MSPLVLACPRANGDISGHEPSQGGGEQPNKKHWLWFSAKEPQEHTSHVTGGRSWGGQNYLLPQQLDFCWIKWLGNHRPILQARCACFVPSQLSAVSFFTSGFYSCYRPRASPIISYNSSFMQPLFFLIQPVIIKHLTQTGLFFFPLVNILMLAGLLNLGSKWAPPINPSISFICSCHGVMIQNTSPRLSDPLSPSSNAKFASKLIGNPQHHMAPLIRPTGLGTAWKRHGQPSKAAARAGMSRGPLGTRASTRLFLYGI